MSFKMRKNNVYTPDGVKVSVDLNDPRLKQHVEQTMIAPYRELIETGWLDQGRKRNGVSIEEKIKKYLERLGTLLLHDPGEYVILTDAMQHRIAARETQLADYLEETPLHRTKRVYRLKEKGIPKSDRMKRVCQQYPGASITWLRVDTENVFVWKEKRYRIDHPDYAPVRLACDVYYPMDRIGILLWQGNLHCFTQKLDEILGSQVTCLATPDCETDEGGTMK